MQCAQGIEACDWSRDGHQFQSQFKFLSLGTYDGILGLDWLAQHSPMNVDWDAQWMSFQHQGLTITLQSHVPDQYACTIVEIALLHSEVTSKAQHPTAVQQLCLLNQWSYLLDACVITLYP